MSALTLPVHAACVAGGLRPVSARTASPAGAPRAGALLQRGRALGGGVRMRVTQGIRVGGFVVRVSGAVPGRAAGAARARAARGFVITATTTAEEEDDDDTAAATAAAAARSAAEKVPPPALPLRTRVKNTFTPDAVASRCLELVRRTAPLLLAISAAQNVADALVKSVLNSASPVGELLAALCCGTTLLASFGLSMAVLRDADTHAPTPLRETAQRLRAGAAEAVAPFLSGHVVFAHLRAVLAVLRSLLGLGLFTLGVPRTFDMAALLPVLLFERPKAVPAGDDATTIAIARSTELMRGRRLQFVGTSVNLSIRAIEFLLPLVIVACICTWFLINKPEFATASAIAQQLALLPLATLNNALTLCLVCVFYREAAARGPLPVKA
jgi:hypothetical protein